MPPTTGNTVSFILTSEISLYYAVIDSNKSISYYELNTILAAVLLSLEMKSLFTTTGCYRLSNIRCGVECVNKILIFSVRGSIWKFSNYTKSIIMCSK